LKSFEMQGKLPRSTVLVDVERVYFQCQKALVRSRLWDPAAQVARSTLPSTGTMIKALVDDASFDAEELRRRVSGAHGAHDIIDANRTGAPDARKADGFVLPFRRV